MVSGITAPGSGTKITVGGTVGQLQVYVTNLVHGEWGYAVSVANATLTTLNSGSSPATSKSSSNITNAVGTTVSGFQAGMSGVYKVMLFAQLPVVATGRSFASIVYAGSQEYRGNTSSDDEMVASAEFYMAIGSSVTFQFFQTTGATQTITGRFNISYLGPL